jgi:AcrR family transcriptional regulator
MPLVVDHDLRRREVAEIAYGLIAQGSTDAATVRNVAAEAGYSTNIVSHYFSGKKDLLQATFDLS